MIHLDTETCGLVGPIVLIQYAEDDGEPTLYEVWKHSVKETLSLLECFCRHNICAFNLAFDWFHIVQLYNLFYQVDKLDLPPYPEEIAAISRRAPMQWCLKPKGALDLFLHLRTTEWQCLMDRKDIRIRRVPHQLAQFLASHLEKIIPLSSIFFWYKSEGYKWQVVPIEEEPEFSDVVLKFGSSSGLKPICSEIFKTNIIENPTPKEIYPEEYAFDPYYSDGWLKVIDKHIDLWENNTTARGYAAQDIILLQRLYHHLGEPDFNDLNSELAVCVGAVRWHGYSVDIDKINQRMLTNYRTLGGMEFNINSHHAVKEWLLQYAEDISQTLAVKNTSKKILESLAKHYGDRPIGFQAQRVITARKAKKELENLEKLKSCGRFCPEFKVIGTLSGRMAGGGLEDAKELSSLNPQGIQRSKEFRELFTFRDSDQLLSGGDFKSFEVVIAQAACKDENLLRDLAAGRQFHAELGVFLYDMLYEEVLSTKGTEDDRYGKAKSTAFGYIYGAQIPKLASTAGVTDDRAREAFEDLADKYPALILFRKLIFDAFCSMTQPNGVGTAIVWRDPPAYIESLLGFRRYFALENRITKSLFDLATNLPTSFNRDGRVKRRKYETQTIRGATQSALFSCAFQLQASNMRAAANHVIQSTGAEINKELQRDLWNEQPAGVHEWYIVPMNLHDEVLVTHKRNITISILDRIQKILSRFRSTVPLLAIDWKTDINNWSDLK